MYARLACAYGMGMAAVDALTFPQLNGYMDSIVKVAKEWNR